MEKRCPSRRIRNKGVIASTVLSQMLYSHNQSANAFQTIIAAYSFASQTGKRVTALLNQLGLAVSPTTFERALKHNASAASMAVMEGIQVGRKIALFYDNLEIYDKKGEESGITKNRSLQLTACGGYFLQLPAENAEEINGIITPAHNIHPPQVESHIDPLDLPHIYNLPIHEATGIRSDLLLCPNPDYSKLNTIDILRSGTVHKYYEKTLEAHLCILLQKHFNNAISKNPMRGLREKQYKLDTFFQIPVVKSEIFTLPTLDLDESTTDGNAAILETLVTSLGFTMGELQKSVIPISRDQMTLSRIRGLKELRVRDRPEHQAGFAEPCRGFLHFAFVLRATGPLHVPYTLRIPCKHLSYAPEPVTLSCTCTSVQVTLFNLHYLTFSLSPVSFYFPHARNINP